MSAWDGLNRRKFPRVNYPCMITVRLEENQSEACLAHTENIGLGGVCVILKQGLKMFSPVEVELDLLDMAEHLRCQGKVVWSVRRRDDDHQKPLFYDVGIEFVNLSDMDSQRITKIVQHLVKQGKTASRS